MRNFIGGLLAVIAGSIVIVVLLGLTRPVYPEPFNVIWLLLAGSSALQSTLMGSLTPLVVIFYLLSWIVIGLIIGPFSKPGWNTVRSALWVGLIHALFSLISKLFLTPGFWESTSRNLDLLSMFTTSLILSTLALPSAIPTAMLIERLGREAELPIPSKIETVCECGAIFKSNPMVCSECGKMLQQSTV
jgi:hypothetical protein